MKPSAFVYATAASHSLGLLPVRQPPRPPTQKEAVANRFTFAAAPLFLFSFCVCLDAAGPLRRGGVGSFAVGGEGILYQPGCFFVRQPQRKRKLAQQVVMRTALTVGVGICQAAAVTQCFQPPLCHRAEQSDKLFGYGSA